MFSVSKTIVARFLSGEWSAMRIRHSGGDVLWMTSRLSRSLQLISQVRLRDNYWATVLWFHHPTPQNTWRSMFATLQGIVDCVTVSERASVASRWVNEHPLHHDEWTNIHCITMSERTSREKMAILRRNKRSMVRPMCGVKLMGRKNMKELMDMLVYKIR